MDDLPVQQYLLQMQDICYTKGFSILPFYAPVTQESTKSLITLLVLRAKTFEITKYYASDYFKVNRSLMNVNCYYSEVFQCEVILSTIF